MKACAIDILEKVEINAFLNIIIKYFEGEEKICKIFESQSTNDCAGRDQVWTGF